MILSCQPELPEKVGCMAYGFAHDKNPYVSGLGKNGD